MALINLNFEEEFRKLKILFYMMGIFSIIFFLFCFLLREFAAIEVNDSTIQIIQIIFPLIILISILTSKNLYKKRVNSYNKNENLDKKFFSYKTNNIFKWSFLEAANIFTALAYFFTGYVLYAILFLLLVSIFLINGMSEEKFVIEYELSPEEKRIIIKK